MAHKIWKLRKADKELAAYLSEKLKINEFIAYLLVARGINTELAVSSFLSDSFEAVSPFNFADMEEAAFTVGDAVDNGERICIYGDYDCDGVTSTALLLTFLKNEGADVFYYIPSREDGYGLNNAAIDKIKEQGAQLIITVDNGITAIEEAEYIYNSGMRLVVTDHHKLADSLPRAEAVINPYREENNLKFRDYCGVGVAFKLICAMYEGDINDLVNEYIDLVALGTIADVVPLVGENRAFVKAGLNKINNNPRVSIKQFIKVNGEKEYSSTDIAFQLCPRINAMGRMGDASRAVEFLISTDEKDCAFKCEQLNLENSHRQETEREILADVERQIAENPKLVSGRVIVVSGKNYHHGVIGIVAANICERYSKPAFVLTVDENGTAVGSARSIEGFDISRAINSCSDLLIKSGGHTLAAGVTLKEENIELFRKRINEYALSEFEIMPAPVLNIDCAVSPHYLSLELVDELSALEPCGEKNQVAVFALNKLNIVNVASLKDGMHTRVELEKKGKRINAVYFGMRFNSFPYSVGDTVNLAVKIGKNFFRDKYYLSVQIEDICLSGIDDDRYLKEKNDYELYRLVQKPADTLYPERETCALLYKYLKSKNGFKYGYDELYFRLQSRITYGEMMIALKAFYQAGLIDVQGESIIIIENPKKVNLEETKALKTLKERLNLG